MAEAHARYGGSTISRTLNCHGWRAIADRSPKSSSEYADRGTLLHSAMQLIYSSDSNFDSRSVKGMEFVGIELTQELYDEKIVPAIAATEEIFDSYGVTEAWECESRVFLQDNSWGTSDLLARGQLALEKVPESLIGFIPDDVLAGKRDLIVGLCADYKFGDGVMVSAKGNDQGLFYSACADVTEATADLLADIDVLVVAIIQPGSWDGTDYSVWEVNPNQMAALRARIPQAVDACEDVCAQIARGELQLGQRTVAGAWCSFCPGMGVCDATNGQMMAMRRLDLQAPDLFDKLPTFDELELAETVCAKLRKLIGEQIDAGADLTAKGYKKVPTDARRKYVDLEAAERVAKSSRKLKKSETHDSKLLSPSQMEKLCKRKGLDFKELFGDYVKSVSGGTKLARAEDSRPGVPSIGELHALLNRA